VAAQTALLVDMLKQNTELTKTVKSLTEHVEMIMREMHQNDCSSRTIG
jgi:hypothetical protein